MPIPTTRRLLAALALVGTAMLTGPPEATATEGVTQVPVAFSVVNKNESGVPCDADGRRYTVRGHLSGPRRALVADPAGSVTLYLYGYEAGEWNWNLDELPAYDHAARMARLGHVSLTIDELGYDRSDHPDGFATCQGAQADMTGQIVDQLRAGGYAMGDGTGPAFSRVFLAGHDIGGEIAEIEAYSHGRIDGLILVTWADQGFTDWILERESRAAAHWCTAEHEQAEDEPGSPTGYVRFMPDEHQFRTLLFHDPEPAVLNAAWRLRNRNPCGMVRSVPTGVFVNKARLREITVPVLVVFGAEDTLVWTREGQRAQARNFTGSTDVTSFWVAGAAHFPMLEKTAADHFRTPLSAWLAARGG